MARAALQLVTCSAVASLLNINSFSSLTASTDGLKLEWQALISLVMSFGQKVLTRLIKISGSVRSFSGIFITASLIALRKFAGMVSLNINSNDWAVLTLASKF